MGLLLEPIKKDLQLSDTQLGFLTGIAFGLFYALLGVPIARWADRGNRVTITSMAIALWGATVMSCLFVTNFVQLAGARVAAAMGEAGCMPPTYSLVGDYFPRSAERTRAMAIYMLASPLSSVVGYIGGGWIGQRYGWRIAFFVAGIPALLVAVAVKATVREPRAQVHEKQKVQRQRLIAVVNTLWERRSTRHLSAAIILLLTMGLGLGPWYAAFMIRNHSMDTAGLGVWFGVIFGVCGTIGILLGGYVASRWYALDDRGQMRLSAFVVASQVPCYVLFLLVPSKLCALIALAPLIMQFNFILAPAFALMQRLVGNDMRATAIAVVMLLANLVGMGIGPQVVGILSDLLRPFSGNNSLRYAMLVMSLISLWAAKHFWLVGETVKTDLLDAAGKVAA